MKWDEKQDLFSPFIDIYCQMSMMLIVDFEYQRKYLLNIYIYRCIYLFIYFIYLSLYLFFLLLFIARYLFASLSIVKDYLLRFITFKAILH